MGNAATDRPVRLVETTLRDGSYAVDFQFTPADTAFIVSTLDAAGVSYIELCHGAGFRNEKSPYKSKVRPAAIDEEHLEAAQRAVKRAKLGVICGAWATEDIDVLVRYGVGFVRIGLLPHELRLKESLAAIDAAKAAGLIVSVNMMQTQMLEVSEVAKIAGEYTKRGVDWLYVVDSAGGMMPDAVKAYVRAIVDSSDLVVGLHAHHNTGMALADSLAAIEAGATRCDSTLQGVGRGTGNPPTEELLLLLQGLGHGGDMAIDPILRLGDLARPLFEDKGQDPTYFASGVAQIHSSNVPLLMKHAEAQDRSPRAFLLEVGRNETKLIGVGVKTLPAEVTDPAIARTPKVWRPNVDDVVVDILAEQIARASGGDLAGLCESLFVTSAKSHKPSILHLVPADQLWFAGGVAWETEGWVGVTAPVGGAGFVCKERGPSVLVVDPAVTGVDVAAGQVVRYAFHRIVADATVDTVEAALGVEVGPVSLEVTGPLRDLLASRLAESGISLAEPRNARVRVVDGSGNDWASSAHPGATIVFLGAQAGAGAAVGRARAAGARVIRPHLGRAVAGRVTALGGIATRVRTPATAEIGSLKLVDAAVAATEDEIVVDDVAFPSQFVAGPGDRLSIAKAVARQRLAAMVGSVGKARI